jgi:two-component sensor histidine kinase
MVTRSHGPERRPDGSPMLSRETDHRIANSLQMIGALVRLRAARANAEPDPRGFLLEVASRIETVGQLHRLISESGAGAVKLSKYLRDICERLGTLASKGASFSVRCSPEQIVPFTVASPLGLITAELISNSLKYAHPSGLPPKITISCTRPTGHRLRFVYEDDGVGFPEEFDVEHDGNLGMRFIQALSDQLTGMPEWSSDSLGLRFEILVPMSAASITSADKSKGHVGGAGVATADAKGR